MVLDKMVEQPYYYSEKASITHAKAMKVVPTSNAASEEMTLLPCDFQPGPMDVICARGRGAYNHDGNVRFRAHITSCLEEYSQAPSKLDKSLLVSSIVNSVRQESPNGGFIRQKKGLWYEVGDHIAREKVGQGFRDLLHTQYRSSTKSKKSYRRVVDARLGQEIDELVRQNEGVQKRMEQISRRVSEKVEDHTIKKMFDSANAELLQYIKRSSPIPQSAEESCHDSCGGCEPISLEQALLTKASAQIIPTLPSSKDQ